jgi:hypothetical protein
MSVMLPWLDSLQNGFDPSTENDVRDLDALLGVKLPPEYVQFLQQYNCGYLKHDVAFRVRQPGPFVDNVMLAECCGISTENNLLDLKHKFERYLDRVPAGFVPVANCNDIDLVCISILPHDFGKVYFWDSEEEGSDNCTYFVADGFSEFLLCLYYDVEYWEWKETLPLFQAIERGELRFVREYLANQGETERRNEQGQTLLMCAIRSKWPKVVWLLLEHGADPNAVDPNGRRPLYYTIVHYSNDSAKLILAAGADPKSCDTSGSTAVDFAKRKSAYRVARTLESHGQTSSLSSSPAPPIDNNSRSESWRQFDLGLAERASFHAALKIAALESQGSGILDCAIECCLNGRFDAMKTLLAKARSFVRGSIEYEETPPFYRRGETEFRRLAQYALCNWLLDKRDDVKSQKAAMKVKEEWFREEGQSDPTETQLALPHYLDAEDYATVIHRFEQAGIERPVDVQLIRGQGTMCYVIARQRLGQEFDADRVQASLQAFLLRRIPEMYQHADYQRIALWMKLAFWHPGDDPIATLLKCLDYLPGIHRPEYR